MKGIIILQSKTSAKTHYLTESRCGLRKVLTNVSNENRKNFVSLFNPLRPNSDPSQTSHCNIKGLSVKEGVRIENMITQVKFY